MKNLAFIALVASMLYAAPNTPASFDMYDTNKDGFVTQEEFEGVKAQRMMEKAQEGRQMKNAGNSPTFEDFDANADGFISKEELALGQQAQRAKQMQKSNKQKNQGASQGKGNKNFQ
ncbi:MAG TPA: hypothetical protein CFH82_02165 [Sulfurospirillum sp. UBA12182]|nr:MAG TPA: hypothetical protein CFH82_02165 [Sulfurospirillum sp. UBA12182]